MNKRQYGLDFLRIIAMLLITAFHYVAYSQVLYNPDLTGYNQVLFSCVSALFVCAVNLFVLITGYFSCEKKINFKRMLMLWVHVVLVGIVLLAIATIFLEQPFKITTLIKTLFPVSTMHYWFFTMYVLLVFASPIINLLLSHLAERQHKMLCITGFFVLSVFFVTNPFIDAEYYIADARGIVWLSYLYIVGAGFRKYDWKLSKANNVLAIFFVYAILVTLQFFKVSAIRNCQLLDSNSVLAFLLSVLLFSLFKDIDFKRAKTQKIISKLSACSFMIYIIQEHDAIRNWYWNAFEINSYASSPFLFVNFLVSVLILWPIALIFQSLLDLIKPGIERLYQKISLSVKKFLH